MEVILNSGKKIFINDKYLDSYESENRGGKTSYVNEFLKGTLNSDFKYRIKCYSELHNLLEGSYESYLDIFGGVGLTGRIFADVRKHSFFNDLDPTCVKILKDNYFPGNVFSQDVNTFNFKRKFDLILADFNNFTLKRYIDEFKPVLSNILETSNKYVIVNDCSLFYLRYGERSYANYSKLYAKTIASREEYFEANKWFFEANHPGWRIKHTEAFSSSSFVLFEKTTKKLPLSFCWHNNSEELVKLNRG